MKELSEIYINYLLSSFGKIEMTKLSAILGDKYTHDLNNYKNIGHYSKEINSWMIKQVKENKHRIREDNMDENLKKLKGEAKTMLYL